MENRSVRPKCLGGTAAAWAGSMGPCGGQRKTLLSRMASGPCTQSRVSEEGGGVFCLCVYWVFFLPSPCAEQKCSVCL